MSKNGLAEDLYGQLIAEVRQLSTSQAWLDAMVAAARFHKYSFGNWMLLWSQATTRETTVTQVAGYRAWQGMGRQVRKGERSYKILAPMTRKDDDGDVKVFGFRGASVFDIAQTDGEPIPTVTPELLEGSGNRDIIDVLDGMIIDAGYTIDYQPLGGANGVTNLTTKVVSIEASLDEAQQMKTLAHELAHVLMHTTVEGQSNPRSRLEIEAESVAYVVLAGIGVDTSRYSVSYVAGWADDNDDPVPEMLAAAESIVKTARRILERFTNLRIDVELMALANDKDALV